MKKLTLSLDQLRVDSFDTSAAGGTRGTVRGEQCTCHTDCTCPGCPTCDYTCHESCYGTCAPNYSCNTMETDKQVICCLQ
jgi:hypothetical protein